MISNLLFEPKNQKTKKPKKKTHHKNVKKKRVIEPLRTFPQPFAICRPSSYFLALYFRVYGIYIYIQPHEELLHIYIFSCRYIYVNIDEYIKFKRANTKSNQASKQNKQKFQPFFFCFETREAEPKGLFKDRSTDPISAPRPFTLPLHVSWLMARGNVAHGSWLMAIYQKSHSSLSLIPNPHPAE